MLCSATELNIIGVDPCRADSSDVHLAIFANSSPQRFAWNFAVTPNSLHCANQVPISWQNSIVSWQNMLIFISTFSSRSCGKNTNFSLTDDDNLILFLFRFASDQGETYFGYKKVFVHLASSESCHTKKKNGKSVGQAC